ncbi:MAG: type II secretion system F family protein [Planctomycetaceae bacterium]|nr:type II secretion system F family protein [Planctomycetaceae bacterium]
MWWSLLIPVVLAACVTLSLRRPKIAVLACPPLLVAAAVAGGQFVGLAPALAMLGILIIVPVLVLSTRRGGGANQWHHRVAKAELIILVGMWVLNLAGGFLATPPPYGPVLFVLAVVLWILYAKRSRDALTVDLITTLAAGVRQNLPLTVTTQLAAEGREDRIAAVLRGTGALLWQGLPLSQAVKGAYPNCPVNVLAGLAMAERLGQLPAYLQSLQADYTRAAREHRRMRPSAVTYVAVVLAITAFVLQMVGIVVMPKFEAIFSKMTRNLPVITKFIFERNPLITGILLLLAVVVAGFSSISLFSWFRPWLRRMLEFPLAATDLFRWYLPGLGWFERNRCLLSTAQALRVTLQAGRPLDEGIANAMTLDINTRWRSGLKRWHRDTSAGQLPAPAARKAGLSAPLAWAFDTENGSNQAISTLEAIEGICRSRYAYRLNVLNSVLWPVMVLILGCWTGMVVLSIFLPMIQLIAMSGK